MLSSMRKHLTYANVAMTLALVFAMTGGAFAASKYLITSPKQIKPSVLKQLQGKVGQRGEVGPAGPVGPAGQQGAQGPKGETGLTGPVGPTGQQGAQGAKGETGSQGNQGPAGTNGAKGEEGAAGKEGSPWTDGGTLPIGATETGTWGLNQLSTASTPFGLEIPISFTIPLAAGLKEANVHIFEGETIPSGCSGVVSGSRVTKLSADSGNFCLYVASATKLTAAQLVPLDIEEGSFFEVGTTGTVLTTTGSEEGTSGRGIWAVTG
jgi:hypothetical protein